jgi:hypothetical protein
MPIPAEPAKMQYWEKNITNQIIKYETYHPTLRSNELITQNHIYEENHEQFLVDCILFELMFHGNKKKRHT